VINFNNQQQWIKLVCPTFAKSISNTRHPLQILVGELKANASSVPSVLGGSQFGHLGLYKLLEECRFI